MNPLNYASLKFSEKLKGNEIILETERSWAFGENTQAVKKSDGYFPIIWKIISTNTILCENIKYDNPEYIIPAPSMIEVWRELPREIEIKTQGDFFTLYIKKYGEKTIAEYYNSIKGHQIVQMSNINPTDALINLLIWTKRKEN